MSSIWKLDKQHHSIYNTKTDMCLNFGLKDLNRVTVKLDEYDDLLDMAEEKIKKLEEENRELRLKTCSKDLKDFEKIIDKDIEIQELEDKIKELENINKKLNLEAQKYYDELIELRLKQKKEYEEPNNGEDLNLLNKKYQKLFDYIGCVFCVYDREDETVIEECCDNWLSQPLTPEICRQLGSYFFELNEILKKREKYNKNNKELKNE